MAAMRMKDAVPVLKDAAAEWQEHKAPRLGAALAYYTVFSLAPLLLIVLKVASLVFGNTAQSQLQDNIQLVAGPQAAASIAEMIKHAPSKTGTVAAILGIVVLISGAAGLFGQLQDALNTIWEVAPKPGRGLLATIKDRFASFAMVGGVCFLLLVSLLLSTALAMLGKYASHTLPLPTWILDCVNYAFAFVVVTGLFAMIYRVLPDVELAWRDVWVGALATAVLFTVGKFLLALYLGRSGVSSSYGAAGSLVVLLLWVYYSGQILFFGAEITRIYATRFGSRVMVSENAVPLTPEARASQGIADPEHLKVAAATGKSAAEVAPAPQPGRDTVNPPAGARPAPVSNAAPGASRPRTSEPGGAADGTKPAGDDNAPHQDGTAGDRPAAAPTPHIKAEPGGAGRKPAAQPRPGGSRRTEDGARLVGRKGGRRSREQEKAARLAAKLAHQREKDEVLRIAANAPLSVPSASLSTPVARQPRSAVSDTAAIAAGLAAGVLLALRRKQP